MTPDQKAHELGLTFPKKERGYLNLCIRTGNLLITSGHVSDIKGKLGAGLMVEEGYKAARECAVKILQSVHDAHGTLDGLRVSQAVGLRELNARFHRSTSGRQWCLGSAAPNLRQGRRRAFMPAACWGLLLFQPALLSR